jgi:5-methylthioadenosine/S-adenosylhomocysteine deaminase
MLLASGIAPVEEMFKHKVRVAVGTDAPNDNQDMLETMKMAALLPRVRHNNPTAVTSYQALKMATIEGAKAVGLDKKIGSLEAGKQADIVIINMNKLHNVPSLDPVSTLVYSSNQSDVDTAFINGKCMVKKGELVNFNEQEIIQRVRKATRNLYKRCGFID